MDVYVYGMTVLSTIHQLRDRYPAADTYQEIQKTVVMPGAVSCTRFPSVYQPPSLSEILELMHER